MGKGGDTKVQQADTLIPSQKTFVNQVLEELVGPEVGKVFEGFPGERLAGIDPFFTEAARGGVEQLSGGLGEIFDPIFAESQRFFEDVVTPQTLESFAAFGGAGSGGAEQALARAGADVSTQLGAELAPLFLQSQLALPGLASRAGGFERQARQEPLDIQQQLFTEEQTFANPFLALGQSFIPGTGQFAENIVSPGQQGFGESLLTAAAPGIGLGLAGGLMFSDERIKNEIKPIDNALDKIDKLEGKTFRFDFKKIERDGGLIAQDVENVLPEAVKNQNGTKYVDYNAVVGLLVNAVRELRRELKKGA